MKILQRYFLRELLLPFAVSLMTLSFIFMAGYLVRAVQFIIGRGVPLQDTLYVLLLALPQMVSYTVPMSLLAAVMIVYGNFSQHNEIRAVKSSGVHPFQIISPALLLGLLTSFLMFIFNDQVASSAAFELRKTTKQLLIKHPSALIEPGRFVPISDSIIFFTKKVENNRMETVVAYEIGDDDKPIRTINAEGGEIFSKPDESAIQIKLYNGSISDSEGDEVQSIQFQVYEFPSFGNDDIQKMRKKKRDMSIAEIVDHLGRPGNSQEDVREYWTVFHKSIAFSFGSLIFAFIGVPIAILVRRGEIVLSFAMSMAAASLYYVLYVGAQTIAIRGVLTPVLALWLPNLFLLAAGFFLMRKSFVN